MHFGNNSRWRNLYWLRIQMEKYNITIFVYFDSSSQYIRTCHSETIFRFRHLWPLTWKCTLMAFRLQAVCQPFERLCYLLAIKINLFEQLRHLFTLLWIEFEMPVVCCAQCIHRFSLESRIILKVLFFFSFFFSC